MFFRKTRHMSILTTEARFLKVLLHRLIVCWNTERGTLTWKITIIFYSLIFQVRVPHSVELYFLFGVTPRGLWPTSGLEFQDKSSVPNIKTFGLDPIILKVTIWRKFADRQMSKFSRKTWNTAVIKLTVFAGISSEWSFLSKGRICPPTEQICLFSHFAIVRLSLIPSKTLWVLTQQVLGLSSSSFLCKYRF